MTAMIIN